MDQRGTHTLTSHLHSGFVRRMCVRSFWDRRWGRHQAQMMCHPCVWMLVLTSWPPTSHKSSTDHWSCVKSPPAFDTQPSSPSISGLNVLISFERLVLDHQKDITGPLQFAYWVGVSSIPLLSPSPVVPFWHSMDLALLSLLWQMF